MAIRGEERRGAFSYALLILDRVAFEISAVQDFMFQLTMFTAPSEFAPDPCL